MASEQNAECQKKSGFSVHCDFSSAVSFSTVEMCLQQMKNKAGEYLKWKKKSHFQNMILFPT
jgi:hypothetical protein